MLLPGSEHYFAGFLDHYLLFCMFFIPVGSYIYAIQKYFSIYVLPIIYFNDFILNKKRILLWQIIAFILILSICALF